MVDFTQEQLTEFTKILKNLIPRVYDERESITMDALGNELLHLWSECNKREFTNVTPYRVGNLLGRVLNTAVAIQDPRYQEDFDRIQQSIIDPVKGAIQLLGIEQNIVINAFNDKTYTGQWLPGATLNTETGEVTHPTDNMPALYQELYLPLPSKRISFAKTDKTGDVLDKIDGYFEDLIRGYPEPIQNTLEEMYYNDLNVTYSGFLSLLGAAGMAFSDGKVAIDSMYKHCPIMTKLVKIHEIAVHIGHYLQREDQIGADVALHEGSDFSKFTEQAAALAEKHLYDALPEEFMLQEIAGIPESEFLDASGKQALAKYTQQKKYMNVVQYINLGHRTGDNVTSDDIVRFNSLPAVAAFLRQGYYNFEPEPPLTIKVDGEGNLEIYVGAKAADLQNVLQERIQIHSTLTEDGNTLRVASGFSRQAVQCLNSIAYDVKSGRDTSLEPFAAPSEILNGAFQSLREVGIDFFSYRSPWGNIVVDREGIQITPGNREDMQTFLDTGMPSLRSFLSARGIPISLTDDGLTLIVPHAISKLVLQGLLAGSAGEKFKITQAQFQDISDVCKKAVGRQPG